MPGQALEPRPGAELAEAVRVGRGGAGRGGHVPFPGGTFIPEDSQHGAAPAPTLGPL